MSTEQELATRITDTSEELVNTWFNRPLASIFVAFFYRYTSISANQVTMLAILFGIAAGILFGSGTRTSLFIGGLFYPVSLVLDCVDGQLARLKGTSSEFGRILDGISDYIVGISILGGTLVAMLTKFTSLAPQCIIPIEQETVIPLVFLGFASLTLHAMAYDLIKTKFTSIIKTGTDITVQELQELKARYRRESASMTGGQRFMMRVYLTYSGLQNSMLSVGAYSRLTYSISERETILKRERGFLRLWSFLGPNTQMVFIMLGALMGDLMFALWLAVIPFNIFYLVMLVVTKVRMRAH